MRVVSFLVPTLATMFFGSFAHADGTLDVDQSRSSVTYVIVHKLHRVEGTSKKVEGKARLGADGQAQVMIRVPVESFDSGNVNRDAHMKETVEAARFPTVELKVIASGVKTPSTFPTTMSQVFKGQVTFHGVSQPIDVPVKLHFESATRVVADAALAVSLDAFSVERPSLMFVKVDDQMKVDAKLTFGK